MKTNTLRAPYGRRDLKRAQKNTVSILLTTATTFDKHATVCSIKPVRISERESPILFWFNIHRVERKNVMGDESERKTSMNNNSTNDDMNNNINNNSTSKTNNNNSSSIFSAFTNQFGEQLASIAKETQEKAKNLLTQTQQQQREQQQREQEQREQENSTTRKNKGDYVRLPIDSAKRLRALDAQDINELERLHKEEVAKVIARNSLLREKLTLLRRRRRRRKDSTINGGGDIELANDDDDDDDDADEDDADEDDDELISEKVKEIEVGTNRVLVIGLQEQVKELEIDLKECEEDLNVSRENTKKCQSVLEDCKAEFETVKTQRDILKNEVAELLLLSSQQKQEQQQQQQQQQKQQQKPPSPPPKAEITNDYAGMIKKKDDLIYSLKDQLAKMTENAKTEALKREKADDLKLKDLEDQAKSWKKVANENLTKGEMKLENALEDAQIEKKKFQTKMKTLEDKLKEEQERAKKFETLASDAMDCGRQLETEANETSTKQISELREAASEYSQRVRELEKELLSTREDLQEKKLKANEQKTKVEAKIISMEQRIKALIEQKDDFEMQKNEAVSEMTAFQLNMELEFEQRLEQRLDKTKENARLEIECKDALNSLDAREKELQRAIEFNKNLEFELNETKKELANFKREYAALEAQMKVLVGAHDNNARNIAPARATISDSEAEFSLVTSLEAALKNAKESKANAMDTIKDLKKELESLKFEFESWRKKARNIMTEKDTECDELRKRLGGSTTARSSSFNSLSKDEISGTSSSRGLDKSEFGYIKAVIVKFLLCDDWTQQEAVLKILIAIFSIDEDKEQLKNISIARRFLEPTPMSTAEVSIAKYAEDNVNYFTNDILGFGEVI